MVETNKSLKRPVIQIMKHCGFIRPIYLLFFIVWVSKCVMDTLQKLVLGRSIDHIDMGSRIVAPLIIVCLLCTCYSYLFTIFNRYVLNRCIEKHMKKLRVRAGYKLVNVPYLEIESMQRGDILSRTMGDLEKIQIFFEQSISSLTLTIISGSIGLFISLYTSWKLTLAVMITIPIIMFLNIITTRSMEHLMMTQKVEVGKGNGIAMNVLQQINAVKAFNLEQLLSGRYFEQLKKIRKSEERIAYKKAALSFVQCLGSTLIYITFMVVGGILVVRKEMTAGDFVIVLMLIEPFGSFAYYIQEFIYNYKECKTGSRRILDILNLPVENELDSEKVMVDECDSCKQSYIQKTNEEGIHEKNTDNQNNFIQFKDVSFVYHYLSNEQEKTHEVLKSINLSIKKGQKVAVVGSSGCGKSTLVKVLCSLYQVTRGTITIDGIPYIEKNVEIIREKIAVVLQENYLFPMTIEENIRCGNPRATNEEVIEAAQKVGIHDFIMSLPNGYQTMLGEDGKTISGGQRQRICIARAYIKRPEILVLDEPTAALDMESERVVEHSLEQLMKDKTTITVAHRLSTIKNSDMIICMEDGRIVEVGTHDELYAKRGRYYSLYHIQEEMSASA